MILSQAEFESITQVNCGAPHDLLGMHLLEKKRGKADALVVRAFLQGVDACEVVDLADPEQRYPLERLSEDGLFEGVINGRAKVFAYRLRIEQSNGEVRQFHDPYCFLPSLSEEDVYYFCSGHDPQAHRKLGAHPRKMEGVPGVAFTVWAPNAKRVSVVGDFNHWDGRYHPMRSLGASGIWELFIPGLEVGAKYKFEIGSQQGYPYLKTDPYGTFFEAPPHNASIVCDPDDYRWNDADWCARRAATDWKKEALSIYEVHLGSWRRIVEDANRP
ncbi:MAG: GlgB N-terminal domain-containing protein, partial [Opitutales bacterium]